MIAIIDYGVGNLKSVEKAFQFIGQEVDITSDRERILKADAVVLPGVGAFADAMQRLESAGMVEVIKEVIGRGKPFLGICLGMQLLFDYSEEGGEHVKGLGVLRGAIRQIPLDMNLKVPHMGWNSLHIFKKECPLFKELPENPYVYFVHSFYLKAEEQDIIAATTGYGIDFHVAVAKGNIYATQFHPEKSGDVGLTLLKNWAELIHNKLLAG